MDERLYWLGFSNFPAIGPAKFRKILEEFGSAKTAWSSARSSARRRLAEAVGEEVAEKFDKFREEFSIEDYLKKLKEKDVWFVTLQDEEYPKLLKEIKNPPFVLYGRGNKEILRFAQDDNARTIAVVGARKTTQYGREVTRLLTTDLVLNGFTIVSGLALGVDAISHMTALENQGKTIAVLGCGVDCCFPGENLSLYNSIVEKGVVVSEFPLGMRPTQWSFPARNRIIAGLSQAVLVTEGSEDSGSLITADYAFKFGRKVFAVPGPITSAMSKGPYKLISRGAKLITSAEDILKDLKFQIQNPKSQINSKSKSTKYKTATEDERKILDLLQNESLHFDEIVKLAKMQSSKLGSILSLMEIKGMIKSLDGGMFSVSFR